MFAAEAKINAAALDRALIEPFPKTATEYLNAISMLSVFRGTDLRRA